MADNPAERKSSTVLEGHAAVVVAGRADSHPRDQGHAEAAVAHGCALHVDARGEIYRAMKTIALLYYDEFSEFEIVLVGLLLRKLNLIAIALENREYRSEEGQRFCVDQALRDVDVDSIDLLVIPGGDPEPLVHNLELRNFFERLVEKERKVAGICGGAALLAGLGVLKGKRCTGLSSGRNPDVPCFQYFAESVFLDDHVVVDGNVITAQGQAYVEFAFELVRQMGLGGREEQVQAGIRWFKNIR
jgi:putative intracellular protease/amidase